MPKKLILAIGKVVAADIESLTSHGTLARRIESCSCTTDAKSVLRHGGGVKRRCRQVVVEVSSSGGKWYGR